MNFFRSVYFSIVTLLTGCIGSINPSAVNTSPDYPCFITTQPLVVKKILVPKGTKLIYEEQFFKKGKQDKMMRESKLTTIELPVGQVIDWGGVPVTSIKRFFNAEMRGFSVYADFSKLRSDRKTKFSELWQSCHNELGIVVKDVDDWSFNIQNILDVENCGVGYQRYFKEDIRQQAFLNEMFAELRKRGAK